MTVPWRSLWPYLALFSLTAGARADHPLLWGTERSMIVGATNVATTLEYIAAGEDLLLSPRWCDESDPAGRLGGVIYRSGRYLLLDHSVDHLVLQTQVAFFGSGSRLDQADYAGTDHSFELPYPYDRGRVTTTWGAREPATRVLSYDELLTIHSAELEAAALLAGELNRRWITDRQLHYREAALFLKATLEPLRQIYGADDDITANSSTNDIACYVRFINKSHEKSLPEDYALSVRALKRRSLIGLINPFILPALRVSLGTHLWSGETTGALPMLSIAGCHYLPAMHLNLSPFGPEYILSNHFAWDRRALTFTVRVGEPVFYYLWGGIGVEITPLLRRTHYTLDLRVELWGQPSLTLGGDEWWDTREGFGCAVLTRLAVPAPWQRLPVDLLLEVGGKTAGYVEGHPLDEALMLRIGFATNAPRGD